MTRSYCLVFHHPHSRETVMIPEAPASPLSRWQRVRGYIEKLGELVLTKLLI